jgi:hypothetical protein
MGIPFNLVTSPGKGVTEITYDGRRFTPADAWPEPITDRNPTQEDADENDCVQRLDVDGDWMTFEWTSIDVKRSNTVGWARTAKWQPKPLDKKTLTIRDLKAALRDGSEPDDDTIQSAIELLEKIQ